MNLDEVFLVFNNTLTEKYNSSKNKASRETLMQYGKFYDAKKLTADEMKAFLPEGVAAVDGSNNSYGGAEPNIIHFLRAVFLPDTTRERVEELKIVSPLIDKKATPKSDLAELEVIVAKNGLRKYHSKALLMDGGLIRYIVDAGNAFKELLQVAKEENTLLIGVIEDMKSRSVAKEIDDSAYDREIFFGKLKPGEVFFLNDKYNMKKESNISTFYFRPGNDPMAISVDYPTELSYKKELAANLVLTLTPPTSRGIPLILDIVDKYAKVSDKDMNYYIKKYIDEDVKRLYLEQARSKRWL